MGTTVESNTAAQTNGTKKRAFNEGKRHFKKNKKQKIDTNWSDGSNEEVLLKDVRSLLDRLNLKNGGSDDGNEGGKTELPEPFTEVDLDITDLSSVGDGLAVLPGSSRVVVVPFAMPGDRVTAKLIRHDRQHPFTVADFVKVVTPSERRDDSRIGCQYFSKCSGCQFQMMSRDDQLAHKRTIIEKAYRHFSGLPASAVPTVGNTKHGEREYGYRTKLTPHFDAPPHARRDRRHGNPVTWESVPPIGFMLKGTRKTMDIEDCPIGTDAVRRGLKRERQRVTEEIHTYKRGATLLCREHTTPLPLSSPDTIPSDTSNPSDALIETVDSTPYLRTCITDPKSISTEYVLNKRFDNPAGAFFQNNNDILPVFIRRIRSLIHPPSSPPLTHLVDAYSGSGLFTVSLSDLFTHSIGIDVSAQSIAFASTNAAHNGIPSSRASFIAGDAADIFAHVRDFPADKTAVVLDPSRKGCDMPFLRQLLEFAPKRVCYVSCNVHTQARDVGVLCDPATGKYEIESVEGFDFFPLTAHVEGLAILRLREEGDTASDEQKLDVTAETVDA
ncbi:S-adenosyl-L-methionine-dependent methyltransferase [Myriangium duriaei CBS 260.36]|uniref:S-adenosyl-L-methionine-dependent methyltransferase n=1 Tax=Myriangium duriaei CBS 260.36 TaxID=1168546 RepID=A0A9P4MGM5_9PEZI|nr:S-adenosyl-L-methionine-dependent methyltransferase [Myriangium duriaei CBS 260.36]